MKKSIAVFVLGAGLLVSGMLPAADPLLPVKEKKIIQFGWDNPTPEYLDRNLEQIETFLPHDGLGIKIAKTVTLPNGKKVSTDYRTFSKTRFQKEWYQKDLEHLKRVHARAKHVKYNFLNTGACNFNNEFNFFDDEFWNATCNNYTIIANLAKQGGCTGLLCDLEDYGNYANWKYRPACGHSYKEAWEKARARGRQWMTAITKEFPDVVIFTFFSFDLMMGYADGSPKLYERLEGCATGLLVAFLNGVYDVLPPKAKIVDGMENHGYGAHELASYYRMKALRENRFPKLLAPENQRKFHEQGGLAVSTYMTCYTNKDTPSYNFRKYMAAEKMNPTEFFRRNFTYAVQFSDEFVWTWNECRKWYPSTYAHAYQNRALTSEKNVPGPYVGMAIPGVEEAMRYAKAPWKYAQDKLKDPSKLKNLVKNPGFEGSKEKYGMELAPDSVVYKQLPNWETWQGKRSKGTFSLAKGKGMNGSDALLAKGVKGGTVHQAIRINPNGAYIVRACAKTINKGGTSLGIQWRNPKGSWCNHGMALSAPFSEDMGNGWKRATVFVSSIPENTLYLSPMLNANAGGAEDAVLYDNVEVFSLFEDEPVVAPHLKGEMEKWISSRNAAENFAKAKKSAVSRENRIPGGNFAAAGNPVAGKMIPQGSLYQAKYQAWKNKKSKAVFCMVAGKNAGFSDDTAAVVIGGDGTVLFTARGPVKAGEKYRVSVKANATGTGRPDFCIYWDSKTKKGPFAYNLGIPKFQFTKQLSNGWMQAEGIITVPAAGTGFTMILGTKGCKTDKDMVFFDDVEATLVK